MNKKMKLYKSLFLLLLGSTVVASEGTQILYSINMPGNPFQQPYYQMMIKADNENTIYPFSATNPPQFYTFNACNQEVGCGSYWDSPLYAASDYVSLYADQGATPVQASIMYGLSPYTFRGYSEGAASKLYMQRPAQVQLPFNPLVQIQSQNGGIASPVSATLPDYSDVFLVQTAANLYTSLGCASTIISGYQGNAKIVEPCTFNAANTQMPSWYTYIPRDGYWRGSSVIFYGTMTSLSEANAPQTAFSPYNEAISWSTRIGMRVSSMNSTYSGAGSTGWVLPKGVFSRNGWFESFSGNANQGGRHGIFR